MKHLKKYYLIETESLSSQIKIMKKEKDVFLKKIELLENNSSLNDLNYKSTITKLKSDNATQIQNLTNENDVLRDEKRKLLRKIEDKDQDIYKLNQLISNHHTQLKESENELNELNIEMRDVRDKNSKYRKIVISLTEDNSNLNKEYQKKLEEITLSNTEISVLKEEKILLEKRIKENNENILKIEETLRGNNTFISNLEKTLKLKRDEVDNYKKQLDNKNKQLYKYESEVRKLKDDILFQMKQ